MSLMRNAQYRIMTVNTELLKREIKSIPLGHSMFVSFDSLCPSQQSFIYVGRDLPGLNQY